MTHLTIEELVDLAEGARDEPSAPHLAECAACREQLADTRAMILSVADMAVPEPSPLFWDRLSARVRDAVAEEPVRRASWLDMVSWPRVLMPVASLAAVVLVVGLMVNARGAVSGAAVTAAGAPVADLLPSRELLTEPGGAAEDPSLSLVADLTGGMDSEAAGEAGLAAGGSAEHAVVHLNDAELLELRRLLAEELTHTGN